MEPAATSDEADTNSKKGLSFIQFLILCSVASGSPFGTEYTVEAVGVGWSILGFVLMGIFLSLPAALISAELISLMPTNHGAIAWSYRAFSNLHCNIFGCPVGDFLGFMNAANLIVYYVVGMPWTAAVFVSYLETWVGDLSPGYEYMVKLAIIAMTFSVNALNINIVGDVINTLILISMIPLLIGFFWELPDIEWSQWTQTCSEYDPALYLGIIVFYAAGYESLGALGGELDFSVNRLWIAYSVAVAVSVLWVIVPIITSATIPYSSCYDWYDGYFAVSYGEIWKPLYYMVLLSSLTCMLAYSILYGTESIRLLWAMAQPHILLLPDGSMLLESEMSLMQGTAVSQFDASGDVKTVPLGILHPKLGEIWERHGSPIGANIAYAITSIIFCIFMTYDRTVIVTVYSYFATFFFVVLAFIVLKFYEPDAPRIYEVPGGKVGAVVASVLTLGIMGFCAIYIGITYYYWGALIWIGSNIVFAIYYFTIKQWLDRRSAYSNLDDQAEPLLEEEANEEVVA